MIFEGDTTAIANTKRPIAIACDNCVKAHIKCDGKLPCARCTLKQKECGYSKKKKRGRKRTNQLLKEGRVVIYNPAPSAEVFYNRSIFLELASSFQVNINSVFETLPYPNHLDPFIQTPDHKFVMQAVAANGLELLLTGNLMGIC